MGKQCRYAEKTNFLNSNNIFKDIFHKSSLGILVCNKEGKVTDVNDEALKITKISKLEDILGMNIFENLKLANKKGKIIENGTINFKDSLDILRINQQGNFNPTTISNIWIDWTISLTDNGYLFQIQDISELKALEDENRLLRNEIQSENNKTTILQDSEQRLGFVQTLGNVGAWELNRITNELTFTPELESLYGLKLGTIKNYQDWRQLVHPDDILKIETEQDENLIKNGIFNMEFRIFHNSGDIHWLSSKAIPIYDDNGSIIRIIGVNTDITESKIADKKMQDLVEQLKQSNEEFHESEERFHTLADNVPNLVWMAHSDGWIFWYNKQWYEYTGTTLEETQGCGWKKVHHPDYFNKVMKDWNTAINEEKLYYDIFPLKGKDGSYRWFLTRIIPIKDKHGKLIRWFGTNTDITEQKKAEEAIESAKNFAENLIETANVMVIGLTLDADVTIFNSTAEKITGFSCDEVLNNNIELILPRDRYGYVWEVLDHLVEGNMPKINENPILTKSGEERYISWQNNEIYEKGKIVGLISFGMDITERKHYEENLECAMADLKRSNKELEEFAHITSHDLREPLRMITSFLQLLKKRYEDQLDDDANDFINFAVNGAKRLDTMTNDLLEYSRISSKKREIVTVKFEDVLKEALTNLKVPIEEINAVITHDPLPTISGYEQLEVQLFQNLIGNALKYLSQDTPKIHITAIKEKNHHLFSIKDNGIGMSPKHLKRIFIIFQRLHTREKYEGTGIGLAIAQKIVHLHSGFIWAESELGKGTTFYFTIPHKIKN